MKRLAFGLVVCSAWAWAACGGKTDLSTEGDAGDAAADVHPVKKDAAPDAPIPYQPLGKKCDPPTAAAPSPWTPDDAGAAQHPPIMNSSGGPTLTNPEFVAITFDGDDLRDSIEDFVDSVGCTSYWHSIAPDYGINDAYAAPPIHLSDTAPATIDDSQIAVYLRNKIVSKAFPDPVQGKTLYIFFYPDTTDITLQGSHSCQSFGGYHNEVGLADGRTVPYAVVPRCDGFGGLGGFDQITSATSHEMMEAVTDPFPMTKPAYQFPEGNGLAWALAGGGEVGDLCEMNDDAYFTPSDYPFYVQRQWTSHAAFGGHDPCQPSTSTYFAAAPVLPDTIPFNFGFGDMSTTGIKIALNASATIDLNIIADATWTSPVSVVVHDAAHYFGGNTALTFNLSAAQGNVGDTLKLTINRIGTNTQFGLEPFVIRAGSGGVTRSWWALVGDP